MTQPIRPPFCGDSIDVEVLGRTRPGRQLARLSLEVVDEGLFAVRYHRVVLSVLCADASPAAARASGVGARDGTCCFRTRC